MATRKKLTVPPLDNAAEPETPLTADEARLIALENPAIQSVIAEMSAKAETVLVDGPKGNGWLYNETLRDEAEEYAAALRILVTQPGVDATTKPAAK